MTPLERSVGALLTPSEWEHIRRLRTSERHYTIEGELTVVKGGSWEGSVLEFAEGGNVLLIEDWLACALEFSSTGGKEHYGRVRMTVEQFETDYTTDPRRLPGDRRRRNSGRAARGRGYA